MLTISCPLSGATIDAKIVPPYAKWVKTLTDQMEDFLSTAGPKPPATPWSSAKTLFSFFIGINDIGLSLSSGLHVLDLS